MPFKNVDDFQAIFGVLEEDYVIFKDRASYAGTQVGAISPHLEGK